MRSPTGLAGRPVTGVALIAAVGALLTGCTSSHHPSSLTTPSPSAVSASPSPSSSPTAAASSSPSPSATSRASAAPRVSPSASVASRTPTPSPTRAAPRTIVVTLANNGQHVTGALGDTLDVELTACGSCGYRWTVTGIPSPAVLRYDGEHDVAGSPSQPPASGSPPAAGGSSTQVFTYTAVGAHTTGLQAGYYGPGQTTPSQRYTLTIQIVS